MNIPKTLSIILFFMYSFATPDTAVLSDSCDPYLHLRYPSRFEDVRDSPMTTRTSHWNLNEKIAVRRKMSQRIGAARSASQKMRTSVDERYCAELPFLDSNVHLETPSSSM